MPPSPSTKTSSHYKGEDWLYFTTYFFSILAVIDIGANHVDGLIDYAIRILGTTPGLAKLFATSLGLICYPIVYFAINGDLLWKYFERRAETNFKPGQVKHSTKERPYLAFIYVGGLVKVLDTLVNANQGVHPKVFLSPYTNASYMSVIQFTSEVSDTGTSIETYLGRRDTQIKPQIKASNLGKKITTLFKWKDLGFYLALFITLCVCLTTLTGFYTTLGFLELTGGPAFALAAFGSFGLYFYPQFNFYVYSIYSQQFGFKLGDVVTLLYEQEAYWTLASYVFVPGFALTFGIFQSMGALKCAAILEGLGLSIPAEIGLLGLTMNPVTAVSAVVLAVCFAAMVPLGMRYWSAFLLNHELVPNATPEAPGTPPVAPVQPQGADTPWWDNTLNFNPCSFL